MLNVYTLKIIYIWVFLFAGFYILQLRDIPDYGLVILLLLLAYPFYRFALEWSLLRRRAFLAHLTHDQSNVRSLLWDSHVVRVLTVFPAVMAAVVLLLTTTAMRSGPTLEWGVLALALAGYLLLLPIVERKLSTNITQSHRRAVAVRTTFWLVLVCVVALSTALWITVYSVPDVRYMDWQQLAQLRFEQGRELTGNTLAGYLIGIREAADALVWYAMQTNSVPLMGWIVFALYQAIRISVVLLFFVGFFVMIRTDQQRPEHERNLPFNKALQTMGFWHFLAGIGIILALLMVFARIAAQPAMTAKPIPGSTAEEITEVDARKPCSGDIVDSFAETADETLSEREGQLNQQLDSYVAAELDNLFMQLERGIDPFLDWNFSMRGQYTLLFGWAAASVSDTEMDDAIQDRFLSFAGVSNQAELQYALSDMTTRINMATQAGLQRLSGAQAAWLETSLESLKANANCDLTVSSTLSFSDITTYSGVGTGAISSAAVLGSARLAVFAAAARRAVTRAFVRRGAVRGGKVATGASTGALCGPLVLVCGTAAFIGADYALIKADEMRNRDAMRQTLVAALHQERQRIEQSLTEQTHFVVNEANREIQQRQNQQFNILRDGLADR